MYFECIEDIEAELLIYFAHFLRGVGVFSTQKRVGFLGSVPPMGELTALHHTLELDGRRP